MDCVIKFIYLKGGFNNVSNPYTKEDFEMWLEHEKKAGNIIERINARCAVVKIDY